MHVKSEENNQWEKEEEYIQDRGGCIFDMVPPFLIPASIQTRTIVVAAAANAIILLFMLVEPADGGKKI